ncbi:MAG: type III-B CRISPR module RAMP protein Cmr6, partial [bacterium]
QSYYSDDRGETPPGDWENPVPIVFLTVKEGIKFKFNVLFDAYKAKEILKMKKDSKKVVPDEAVELLKEFENNQDKLKEEIRDLLEKALKEFGVGAKTRLGYGLFE